MIFRPIPSITTIIPTYRRPWLLRRAILSVLSQTNQDFQVCVYDNASGDKTAGIVNDLAKIDSRVRYFCHPVNIGMSGNFLFGVKRVNTPYFSILSDDDVLLPDFFKVALSGLAKYPQALFFAGSTLQLTADGKLDFIPLASWPREGLYQPPEGFFRMVGNRHPRLPAILFRRDVLLHVGYPDDGVGAIMDADFEYRVAIQFPIVISFKPCGIFVRHPAAITDSADLGVIDCYHKMIDNVVGNESLPTEVRQRARRLLIDQTATRTFEIGIRALLKRDHRTALEAASLLSREFHRPLRSKILKIVTSACSRAPQVSSLLASMIAVRAKLHSYYCMVRSKASRSPEAPKHFGDFSKFLREQARTPSDAR